MPRAPREVADLERTETMHAAGSAPGAARPLGAILRVEGASARPARLVLRADGCIIGSGPASDIVIDDPTVSRSHAEARLVPEGLEVRDLESRNGTFYLGQRVGKIILTPGSRLQLGRATLCVDIDREQVASAGRSTREEYGALVGRSPAMQRLFAILERLEGALVSVLVEGESGVGKELVARAIHDGSRVKSGPFVSLNCGAFARELLGSELFGHKKGAFTGATDNRRGAIDTADGGTLFLDELGEMPSDVQPMLLRFLESGEIRPLGSDVAKKVNTRIIAATNRDLERLVQEGQFREDLFYRLAVVRVTIPPLRERREDIEPIARRIAKVLSLEELPPTLLARLSSRSWPGNVRELRNVIQAYSVLGDLAELPTGSGTGATSGTGRDPIRELVDIDRPYLELKAEIVDRLSRAYFDRLLERTGGNQAEAARLSGVDRTYLGRLLQRLTGGR
jgi:DNA-binding NtrC family response regulator